jgi:hypothetical protein
MRGGEALLAFDRFRDRMFADPSSELPQNGKMVLEGRHRSGYFQNIKSYFLRPLRPTDRDIVKCKGVPGLIRRRMTRDHFAVKDEEEEEEERMTASWQLGPTAGREIVLSVRSRRLPGCVNYKRFSLVGLRPPPSPPRSLMAPFFFLGPLPDPAAALRRRSFSCRVYSFARIT